MNYREIMSRLNVALNNVDLVYSIIAKRHGLTFNSLMMFYLIDEAKNITQKQICDELYLPKSTVHSILLDLIKRDYVTLVEGNNKKEKFIIVTATGKQYFSKILEETRSIEKNVLDALGEETCTFLTKTVDTIGNLMMKEIARINEEEVS